MDSQVAVVLATVAATLVGGVGWLLRRYLTAGRASERSALLNSLADLSVKLRSAGLSLGEVKALERHLFAASGSPSAATVAAVAAEGDKGDQSDDALPKTYFSARRVLARAEARQGVLDNQLAELLLRFEGLWPDERYAKLRQTLADWQAWRESEVELAALQFDGAPIQPVARALARIKLTEEHIARLDRELAGARQLARTSV
jgi:hypothetical protein